MSVDSGSRAAPNGVVLRTASVDSALTPAALVRLRHRIDVLVRQGATHVTVDLTGAGPVPFYIVSLFNRLSHLLTLRDGQLSVKGLSGFEAAMLTADGLDDRVVLQPRSPD